MRLSQTTRVEMLPEAVFSEHHRSKRALAGKGQWEKDPPDGPPFLWLGHPRKQGMHPGDKEGPVLGQNWPNENLRLLKLF